MHAEFSDLLETLTPSTGLIKVSTVIFGDVWDQKMKLFKKDMEQVKNELIGVDDKIQTLLDRILKAESDTLITAYENRIQELERKKLVLTEKLAQKQRPLGEKLNTFKEAIKFLSNPQKLWNSDKVEDKKAVLKLAFSERLPYTRNIGFGTPNLSLPFKALGANCASDFTMVPLGRIELPTSSLPMTRSTTELQRPCTEGQTEKIHCQNGAEDAIAFKRVQALFQNYLRFEENVRKLALIGHKLTGSS